MKLTAEAWVAHGEAGGVSMFGFFLCSAAQVALYSRARKSYARAASSSVRSVLIYSTERYHCSVVGLKL